VIQRVCRGSEPVAVVVGKGARAIEFVDLADEVACRMVGGGYAISISR
jgi:hypothetical protein